MAVVGKEVTGELLGRELGLLVGAKVKPRVISCC